MRGTAHVVFMLLMVTAPVPPDVTGKRPSDETTIHVQYYDLSGKLHNVEVIRCRLCGQVISELHYGCEGRLTGWNRTAHWCGKYARRN